MRGRHDGIRPTLYQTGSPTRPYPDLEIGAPIVVASGHTKGRWVACTGTQVPEQQPIKTNQAAPCSPRRTGTRGPWPLTQRPL